MYITIQDLIDYFEKQIKSFKTQERHVSEKRQSIERDRTRAFDKARIELNYFLETSLKQAEYQTKIQELANAMVLDFEQKKSTLQAKEERLTSSVEETTQKLEELTSVYERHQALQDAWNVFQALDSLGEARVNYRLSQEKYEHYISQQQEYQSINVYASRPRTFLEECVNDGWLVALWKQRKYPELKSFYQLPKEDRRKWAEWHKLDMLTMVAGTIQQTQEYLDHLSIRIEQLSIQEHQLKHQMERYYEENKDTIQQFETLYQHRENEQKERQRIIEQLEILNRKIEKSQNQAYQDAKEMVIDGHPSFGALSMEYQHKLRIIKQNEQSVNSQCDTLLSQLKKLEHTLTKTKAKFENKLSDLNFKTRRLSYYDKRSQRVHAKTYDYARDIDNSYDIDDLNFDALFLGFVGGAFLVSTPTVGDVNVGNESFEMDVPAFDMPDIAIPDINIPEVSIPEITIPEISIPDISVPETSFSSSFDSFSSD